ncbi:MAG: hypothetical protein KDJ27_07690, partial [Gammaproteobacteria bacterium]|nr:hypothetical protein [Gammaproteobacteria bacterium]
DMVGVGGSSPLAPTNMFLMIQAEERTPKGSVFRFWQGYASSVFTHTVSVRSVMEDAAARHWRSTLVGAGVGTKIQPSGDCRRACRGVGKG